MPELHFKGKEYVYNHHLSVPFRPLMPHPDKSVGKVDNPRYWGDGKPGNEVDGPWQRTFIDCIKEGKRPPLEFEQSHRATVCCHLANIAYRVGRQIAWDGESERIAGDPEATALLSPPRRKGYELPEV